MASDDAWRRIVVRQSGPEPNTRVLRHDYVRNKVEAADRSPETWDVVLDSPTIVLIRAKPADYLLIYVKVLD
jgi:hypothetical protein